LNTYNTYQQVYQQRFTQYCGFPAARPDPVKLDGSVKSPDAALRFIPRHCGVRKSTPHSSGFTRLACGLFTKPSNLACFLIFYEFIKLARRLFSPENAPLKCCIHCLVTKNY